MLLRAKVACATPGCPATRSVPSAGSPSPASDDKWEFISERADAVKVLLQELSAALIQAEKYPIAGKKTPAAKEMFLAPLKIVRNILRGKRGNWLVLLFLSFLQGLFSDFLLF